MATRRLSIVTSILILASILLSTGTPRPTSAEQPDQSIPDSVRMGAWVDTIHIRSLPNNEEVITELQTGNLDLYAQNLINPDLYKIVLGDPDLEAFTPLAIYYDLTFNPAGPIFGGNGKLNPFAVPKIREAMNWLVDRRHLIEKVYGGLGVSKYVLTTTSLPDYARYQETIQGIEATYAYNFNQANAVIASEMNNLGAAKVGGKWHYNGQPVVLIFIIRTDADGTRLPLGDYIADQLEKIGFTIDRQYKTSAQATPIWLLGDPNNGQWHLYTGAWSTSNIARDEGGDFQFFYTPKGYSGVALWQAYTPTPEFQEAADKLADKDYASWSERNQLFEDALEMSMKDSVRIWLVQGKGFLPRSAEVSIAHDLVGGLWAGDLWPYTVRFKGQIGGTIEIAQATNLVEPWNPVSGSSWPYDRFVQRATQDEGLISDPKDGLRWPQRIESAEVTVQQGLPVIKTLDWATLKFASSIQVPNDAWVDWDPINQVWITSAEKFTEIQTAKIKSVVTYPSDLFSTVTWHDGSPLSVADFVMQMIIMPFDIANPDSPIYNETFQNYRDYFLSFFKGYRITSTSPLVIEYYTDNWHLDAEWNVYPMWPDYGYGEGSWHTMAIAYRADAGGELAFSMEKANSLGIEWMNFINQPSINVLKGHLNDAQGSNFIPYANTLGAYITPAEATTRYNNLQAWYANEGHFWIGTGPFYLDAFSHDQDTVTLQRYPAFSDPAGKWDKFSQVGLQPTLQLNYNNGAPGSSFNVHGSNFPINSFATISLNYKSVGTVFTGPDGEFTFTLTTQATTDEGYYLITASINPSASIMMKLKSSEPIRPKEGDHSIYPVPDGIALQSYIYLPIMQWR